MRSRRPAWRLVAVLALLVPLTGAGIAGGQAAKVKPAPAVKAPAAALVPTPGPDFFKAVAYRGIGPTEQGGRFTDFAVPLQTPSTFYASLGSGGLWKTENHGETYAPIFDFEKSITIGDIAVAPSDPNVVYVGTGEANTSRSTYAGDGVYKSVDAGKTWTNVGLPESHHIGRIVVHPTDPNVVYVAALGHLYSPNPERGLYKSADGGKTWTKSLDVTVDGRAIGCVDVVMDPKASDTLYAATYDKHREPWTFMLGGPGSAIYKTTDAGKTWAKLGNGLPGGILGRIGLAIYPKNPAVLYAVIENANKPGMSPEDRYKEILAGKSSSGMIDGEVYRTDDAGATWRKVSPEKQSIGSGPGYYYADIIVDPNDDQHVYALSVGVQESKDGGKTWGSAFRFGGDNHALWIDPADSKHMLLGYDHGMGVTWDGGLNWHHPDHLPTAQFYAIDFDTSYPYRVAGGLQDNGSVMGPSTRKGGAAIRLEDWSTVGGGDGMYNVFDRKTNRYLYNESQFGPLQRTDLLTGEGKSIAYARVKPATRWNWNAPILVSVHNPLVLYHGGNVLVRSDNRGETWTEISPDLTTNDAAKMPMGKGGDGNIQYCTITTLAESPLVPGLVWVGTDDGLVWVTKDDGRSWAKVSDKIPGHPGCWISRVEASSFDPGTGYVAVTGFREDDFKPYLFKTTDYGQTWASIAANLPNEPLNVIREDPRNPNLLFVGTDAAVYVSLDGGGSWTRMKGDMPTNPVYDLKIHPREHDLIVATHGRGAFITDVSALEEMTPEVLGKAVHLFPVEPKFRWSEIDRGHSSSRNFQGESEPAGLVINYTLKAKPKAPVKVEIFKGRLLVNVVDGKDAVGLNSVVWDMSQRRELSEEEKKAAQGMRGRFAGMGGGQFGGFGGRQARDPNFAYSQALEGDYTVVLVVDGQRLSAIATIMKAPS